MEEGVHLTNQEAWDLVHTILEGIDADENEEQPRDTWSAEMRDWCLLILDRVEEGGSST